MKKHNLLALILMMTLMTSCAEKKSETIERVSAAVETVETEISSSSVNESGSFYIKVTDWDGIEKLIYYEMPPEKGYEPYVHMEEVNDNPESRFGYASVIPYEAAKWNFIHSGIDSMYNVGIGGMVNAHMPASYYFIALDTKNKLV